MNSVFSSRDFTRDPAKIKRAAQEGVVIITDRGQPMLAVLSYADYRRISGQTQSILEALAMPGIGDIELDL